MENYILYKTITSSINTEFKFNCIGWYKDDRLFDYILNSLVFINERLISDGAEDILEKIKTFKDSVVEVNNLILLDKFDEIKFLISMKEESNLKDFTLAWGTLTSTMLVRLYYNYASLMKPTKIESECDCYKRPDYDPTNLFEWIPINDAYEFGNGTVETFDNSEYEYNKFK